MKKIAIVLGIFLCLGCVGRIVWINQQYPQAQVEKIALQEEYTDKDGVVYMLQSSSWIDKDAVEEKYAPMDPQPCYLVNLKITNTSQKKQSINLCEWYLEGDNYYSQGVSAELYWVLNPEVNDFEIDLEAKETVHVVLPYEMVKTIENDHAWDEILGGEYGIVKDRYPDKIWLCMN